MRLLVATRSTHKVAEIRCILAGVPDLELLDLDAAGVQPHHDEDGLEPHSTFEANARSKACHFRRLTGLAAVADDSGIEVDALGGAPGVRSRRFALLPDGRPREEQDQANNRHLLLRLADVPPSRRTARYVCVAALAEPDGREMLFRGTAEGTVLQSPRGAGGFGYDPLFLAKDLGRTFAEVTRAEKDAASHRGKAFRALAAYLLSR